METNELILHLLKERDLFFRKGMTLAQNKCQSDEVGELAAAFAKAQKEFTKITKDTKGYNYKYSQLDQILNVVRPALNEHELSLSQSTTEHNILVTRLRHTSGQWIESRMKLPDVQEDNKRSLEQAWGSTFTYMRRYQILALLAIHPSGEDDDARKL